MYTIKYIDNSTIIEFQERYETKKEAIEALNRYWNKLKSNAKEYQSITPNKIIIHSYKTHTLDSNEIIFKNNEIIEQLKRLVNKKWIQTVEYYRIFIDNETNTRTKELKNKRNSIFYTQTNKLFNVTTLKTTTIIEKQKIEHHINIPDDIKNISEHLRKYIETIYDKKPTRLEWEKTSINVTKIVTTIEMQESEKIKNDIYAVI